MATTEHRRTRETLYGDPQDLHPTREKHNEEVHKRGDIVALFDQGQAADRPAASLEGMIYLEIDTDRAVLANGTKWIDLNTTGGESARDVAVGGTSSEGTSVRGARADHTHRLRWATRDLAGALSPQHFRLLDDASQAPAADTLAQRDSWGRVAGPTRTPDSQHYTTRAYVEQLLKDAQIGVPIDTYATGGTVAKRWSGGQLDVADPLNEPNAINLRTLNAKLNDKTHGYLDIYQITQGGGTVYKSHFDWLTSQFAGKASSSHTHSASDIRKEGVVPWEVVSGSTSAWSNTSNHGSTWATVAVDSAGRFFRYTSALKYKTNVRPLEQEIDPDVVDLLQPVLADYLGDPETGIGAMSDQLVLIADDVAGYVPQLVIRDEQTGEIEGLHYLNVSVLLMAKQQKDAQRIKRLQWQNEDQQRQIDELRDVVRRLAPDAFGDERAGDA